VLVLFQLVSDPKNQNKGFIERAVSVDFITVFKDVLNDPRANLKQCIKIHSLIDRIAQHLQHLVLDLNSFHF